MVQRGSIDYYSYLHNHQLGGKIEEDIPWSGMDQTTRYDIFWKDSQILRVSSTHGVLTFGIEPTTTLSNRT